jgi:alcohol dehydrogenase class IV
LDQVIHFDFSTAGRILFGNGTVREIKNVTPDHVRVLLVQGPESINAGRIKRLLEDKDCQITSFVVAGEPTVALIEAGTELARSGPVQWVISVGGGSVIDAGKAIAAMATNPGSITDYLEVIGKSWTLTNPSLPMAALPTTAGTGSEVTRNAVITAPEGKMKVSLRGASILPRVAIVDPELALSLPPAVTASTGMDALAQVLEPFVSRRANAFTDQFCREGLSRTRRSLTRAFHDGNDLAAREDMSFASLLGGLALANAGLGAVHGFASPIGGMFPAPHGAVCARLLPAVVRTNVEALRGREPESSVLSRYHEAAHILTGKEDAPIEEGIAWLENLVKELYIPPLSNYGISENDIPAIVAKSITASSMKTNPIQLTEFELEKILRQSI